MKLCRVLSDYMDNKDKLTYFRLWLYRVHVDFLVEECNKKRSIKKRMEKPTGVYYVNVEHLGCNILRSEVNPNIFEEVPTLKTWMCQKVKRLRTWLFD